MTGSTEIWKPVLGWPLYEVSDHGRVRSWKQHGRSKIMPSVPKVLAQAPTGHGYPHVTLSHEGASKSFQIHTLVLTAFVGPRPPKLDCCHDDGTRTNNHLGNLSWGTRKKNFEDRDRHGRTPRGEKVGGSKLTADQVIAIRADHRTHVAIAPDYGVSRATISLIKERRTWRHLTQESRP